MTAATPGPAACHTRGMGCAIHLLGVPRLFKADGSAIELRGQKAWGLLTYLVAQRGPVSRQQLARLLFEDADDPLGALRWNLTELRRALGSENLRGDTLLLDRSGIEFIDVEVLRHGRSSDAVLLPGLDRELLEGLDFANSASFEAWLNAERRRTRTTTQAVLNEAALGRLAAGAAREAVDLAARLLVLDPLNENAQVLLVRCLAAAGDGVGAARQAAACRDLFQRELGVAPGPALADALHTVTATAVMRPAGGRAGALAQLEAGEAAIGAGVLEAGLQCLRRAIVDSDATGDPVLRARARIALGSALVHAARGRDSEGAAALHEALAIGAIEAPGLVAAACRELGYVEFLLGHYDRALTWVERAKSPALGHLAEQGRIATLEGSILSDMACYGESLQSLRQARLWCLEAGDTKQAVYADSMIGRTLVLTNQLDEAERVLEACVDQARRTWTAFLPWPESFRAEVDLLRGRVDRAAERFEQAFALGCQLSDPCWEGIAGRGLGLVAAARGHAPQATEIFIDTLQRCARLPDAYVWGRAYVMESLCRLAVEQRDPRAQTWVGQLLAVSASAGMTRLVELGHEHLNQLHRTQA